MYRTVHNISIVSVITFKNLSTVPNITILNALIYYFYYSLFSTGDSSTISIMSFREKSKYHSVRLLEMGYSCTSVQHKYTLLLRLSEFVQYYPVPTRRELSRYFIAIFYRDKFLGYCLSDIFSSSLSIYRYCETFVFTQNSIDCTPNGCLHSNNFVFLV